MESAYIFSFFRIIIDDYIYIFTQGRLEQKILYIIIAIVSVLLFFYILEYAIKFASFLKRLVQKFLLLFDKDYQLQKKAKKYDQKKNEFNRKELEKIQKIEMEKEQQLTQELNREMKAKYEEYKRLKTKELIAYSNLDFSFFLPENGYPYGPSLANRFGLEEERIRQSEKRLLTEPERHNIRKGLSADASPFGTIELQEIFEELWKESPDDLFRQSGSDRSSSLPKKTKIIELHRR